MKPTKKTRLLPSRGGLNDLGRTGRTINDYSKAVPTATQPNPAAIRVLALPKDQR